MASKNSCRQVAKPITSLGLKLQMQIFKSCVEATEHSGDMRVISAAEPNYCIDDVL